MSNAALCQKLRKLLSRLLKSLYGQDLDAILAARGHELWLLGIDSKKKAYVDICGSIPPTDFQIIVNRGFFDTDAGFRVSAQHALGVSRQVDIFLLNTDYFSLEPKKAIPLIVHELAHLVEQLNYPTNATKNDEENADAILASLETRVRNIHTREWALHLAVAGRVMLQKKLTTYTTIRSFLEAAIPSYDRLGKPIKAKKGW